jgi:hypothetical protein
MKPQSDALNYVNMGLMAVACAAAYVLPFELFLFSYAVLGPLHYLTEIFWLHDHGYFTRKGGGGRWWLWVVGAAMVVIVYGIVAGLRGRDVSPVLEIGLFYLAFAGALAATDVLRTPGRVIVVIGSLAALLAWSGSRSYAVTAFLLITIIHVFVFTGAFLLFGAIKTRSLPGLLSVAVFAACGAAIFFVVPNAQAYSISPFVRESYGPFNALNAELIRLFGLGSGTTAREVYESRAGLSVMRFIAFAYTYHYLNWFSKTSVIGWHRSARPRAIWIAAAWTLAMVLYARNFRLGMSVLYSLSILHVMLEFPLDHKTFHGLAGAVWGLISRAKVEGVRAPSRQLRPAR